MFKKKEMTTREIIKYSTKYLDTKLDKMFRESYHIGGVAHPLEDYLETKNNLIQISLRAVAKTNNVVGRDKKYLNSILDEELEITTRVFGMRGK